MDMNVLYLNKSGEPVGLRINGRLVEFLSADDGVVVDYSRHAVPRVRVTFLVPGLVTERVAVVPSE